MTTLAGRKIRQYRERQAPKMGRAAFGDRMGVKANTVQGWEEEGKRPDKAEVVNQIAADGIAAHADWYIPAICPRCSLPTDFKQVARCRQEGCPIVANRRGALPVEAVGAEG